MSPIIPVVLFAYARSDYLRRTLACLRDNNVPLIYAYSDGPKTPEMAEQVGEVRRILREINWCEVHLVERAENLGLGTSILTGVSEVFQQHDTILVFEDDLVCVPGTYEYLCNALVHYKDEIKVMSVTGWTHPRVTPANLNEIPYFDGRTDCLVWGTWRRAWYGMEKDSIALIEECQQKKIDIYRYGADLVRMAEVEKVRNLWAVRFSYLHILKGGLCLRPPYSLVEHIGYDSLASNAGRVEDYAWSVKLPKKCPPLPRIWPEAVENPECPKLWQRALPRKNEPSFIGRFFRNVDHKLRILFSRVRNT